MTVRQLILICGLITTLLCVVQFPALHTSAKFIHASVRTKSTYAIDALRGKGLWLVNAKLIDIAVVGDVVCYQWEYQYRSRNVVFLPDVFATCF